MIVQRGQKSVLMWMVYGVVAPFAPVIVFHVSATVVTGVLSAVEPTA
ncbi:hypothetical protein [Actinosynnema sp. NPDC023587]